MSRARAFVLTGVLLLLVRDASAANPTLAAAESLFDEGHRLALQGNYTEACKRFTRSQELSPAVGTLLNLGECHEHLNELAQSWLAYRQAITLAETMHDSRVDHARKGAERLQPRVPRLTIVATKKGATVTRDGTAIEAAALDAAIAVDPGRHVIAATSPDHEPWQTTVELAEGQSLTVTIPPLVAASPSPRRTVGIGMEIGGGALLAAGLVSGTIALTYWNSVESACPDAGCPRAIAGQQQRDVDTARTWATLATVGIIGGATILAAGVALHLTANVGRDTAGVTLVWYR